MSDISRVEFDHTVDELRRAIEAEAHARRAEIAQLRAAVDSGLGGMRQDISNIRADINTALGEMRGNMLDQQRSTQVLAVSLVEQSERMKAIQEQIAGERGLSLMGAFKEMRGEIAKRFDRQDEDVRGLQRLMGEMGGKLAGLETRYNADLRERARQEAQQRKLRQTALNVVKALLSNRMLLVAGGALLGLLAAVAPTLLQAVEVLFR